MTEPFATGQVLVEGEGPLAGVVVSNGCDVVRTDGEGRYRLSRPRGCRFVSATVPGGYSSDRFYLDGDTQDLDDGEIRLRPRSAGAPERFTFAQITDMHLSTERRCLPEDLAEDLAAIIDDGAGEIDFFVASGDLTAGGKQEEFAAYRRVIEATGLPVFHAAGNHDDDAESAARHFQDALGPLSYSFDWGAVHFVVYDGEAFARSGGPVEETAAAFPYRPAAVDDWMRADLAMQPAGTAVVVINHFPWGREFYDQWHGNGIVAVLSGHWHASRRHADGDTVHYATPSLCFGGIDQSQRGYRLFHWRSDGLQSETRVLNSTTQRSPGISLPVTATIPKAISGVAGELASDWPQFHGGPSRRGASPKGPAPPLARRWHTATGGHVHTASCVVAHGRVYQTTMDDDTGQSCGVTAIDAATGELCWRHRSAASVRHAAACAQDSVFAMTVTGELLCLAAESGACQWRHQLAEPSRRWVFGSPLVSDGYVYAGVSSDFVALDADSGEVLWRRQDFGPDDWISSYPSPAAAAGRVVVAFYTQPTALAVLDAATGQSVWELAGSKATYMYATPVVGTDQLFTVSGGLVRAFDLETGDSRWEQEIRLGRIQATPALAGERLFVATGSGKLHALHVTDGRELWQWSVESACPLFTPYVRSGPTTLASPVVAGGVVWVAAADGCLYGLDEATGELLWSGYLGAPLAAAPAIGAGALFIGATDGTISALFVGGTKGGLNPLGAEDVVRGRQILGI